MLSGYMGKSDVFDKAIGDFAVAYADQNEQDHAALDRAVKDGRLQAVVEEPDGLIGPRYRVRPTVSFAAVRRSRSATTSL